MKKYLSIILSIVLLSLYIYPSDALAAESWPAGPSVASGSAIVMEASTGTVLYGVNQDTKKYPASITKIMTALVALENASLDDTITFSSDAVNNLDSGSAVLGVTKGEKLKLKDALYALMLASANDVANGIAEMVGGSNAKFAKLMNAKAKEVGCKNTNFVNPHGLTNEKHYTTAYDMAMISRAALKNSTFCKVTSTASYKIPKTNKSAGNQTVTNHQQMLTGAKNASLKYEGCIGGKTGYTSKAGNTLVTFAKRNGMTLISVVMDSNYSNQYADSKKLLDFGFSKFKLYNVTKQEGSDIKDDLQLFTQYFEVGKEDSAYIYIDEDSSVVLPSSVDYSKAKKKVDYIENVEKKNGDNKIGTISYTYGGKNVGTHDIIMQYYTSSSIPTVKLPNSADSYSLILQGNNETSVGKFKPVIIDTVFVAVCIIVILAIYLFFKQMFKKRRRRRAYNSRRRYSRQFWDDLNM